jgi:hypothetical protein
LAWGSARVACCGQMGEATSRPPLSPGASAAALGRHVHSSWHEHGRDRWMDECRRQRCKRRRGGRRLSGPGRRQRWPSGRLPGSSSNSRCGLGDVRDQSAHHAPGLECKSGRGKHLASAAAGAAFAPASMWLSGRAPLAGAALHSRSSYGCTRSQQSSKGGALRAGGCLSGLAAGGMHGSSCECRATAPPTHTAAQAGRLRRHMSWGMGYRCSLGHLLPAVPLIACTR